MALRVAAPDPEALGDRLADGDCEPDAVGVAEEVGGPEPVGVSVLDDEDDRVAELLANADSFPVRDAPPV